MIRDTLMTALHSADKARPRSRQVEIGPSSLGGCRRQVWHDLRQSPVSNPDTKRLAAVMGTAIHDAIEHAFRSLDPWGDRYLLEVEVEHDGLMGHVDLYDKQDRAVVDWKTTKLKSLRHFPSESQWWQVQTYGALMVANGYPVDTVSLVALARDGDEDDIVEVSQPFDPSVAEKAAEWLADVRGRSVAPEPERPRKVFCEAYCGYYEKGAPADSETSCPGR